MTAQISDSTSQRIFRHASRLQQSMLAKSEKQFLIWTAGRLPHWLNSDHLTALGFAAQLLTGLSYAFVPYGRIWLFFASGFLVLNWFGDSMDGTLARVRNQQRPRYGFYVDHMLDSIGAVALMGGLARSGLMGPGIATGLLVLFLLLSIQSYLATYTLEEFRMSFWSFGPTELRLLLIAGNFAVLRWPTILHGYRLFDIGGVSGIAGMGVMVLFFTVRNTARLYAEERVL
ncbi:MAG TPA: CDP-alcohol phosphatidyltransferase family protein [Terriglobales bacterium]|jgi:phosphatidylglycerophosphate synthase